MRLMGITPGSPESQFTVPADAAATLRRAIESGEAAARAWTAANPGGSEAAFDAAAHDSVPAPPDAAATQRELDQLHTIATARTPSGDAAAEFFDMSGGWDMWQHEIESIAGTDGPVVAREAWAAMRRAVDRVSAVSDALKAQYHRTRPFQSDPSLTTVGRRPTDGSYPSGHTAAAVAAAMAIADVVPARRDELVDLACKTAWSRVYAGVHHFSDVLAGAQLASRVAADVARRELAQPHAA